MPNFVKVAQAVLLITFTLLLFHSYTLASHCPTNPPDYDCLVAEIQREIDAIKPAHEQNKQELANLRKQVTDIQTRINSISSLLNLLEKNIASREEDLGVRIELFEAKTRAHYMTLRQSDPLAPFLLAESAADLLRQLSLRQRVIAQDQEEIEKLAGEIVTLKHDKETLTASRASLKTLQAQLDTKADFLAGEVAKVESYIATLTAKQEQLLAQKAGGFQTSVGDTPPTLEPCSGPPGSANYCDPGATAFAAFSFGAPHRKGMSQFGALGRSKAGQNYETILRAYYGDIQIRDANTSLTIKTTAGAMDFEGRYLPGIAEMPTRWADEGGFEALKAQAMAARSYALAYTGWRMANQNAGGTICTSEACQVWSSSKADNPGKWKDAVEATRGKIMVGSSGEVVNSWYASTAGGYTLSYTSLGHSTPGQWDADGGRGGWPDNAWDKKGGSPWFYKGWYRTRGGSSCGRSHPWLQSAELADVLNAWQVLYRGGGDVSRISPITTDCWPGNPYSVSELAGIGGYISVSGASVVYGDNGSTLNVTFSTNKGNITLAGDEFKRAFNLRAPGFLGIKSSLFNLVRAN